jgi:hypothetical protein
MKKSIYILASVLIILFTNPIFAQADPGDDPDAPGAPIGDYLWVLALIGLVIVFLRVRAAMLQGNSSK